MMQTSTRSWEDLRSGARAAERTLEDKIAAYTAVSRAQSRSSAAAYDEGGQLHFALAGNEEADNVALKVAVTTSSVKTQDAMLQRYRELYFDFKTEFRRSMVRMHFSGDTHQWNVCQSNAAASCVIYYLVLTMCVSDVAQSSLQEKRDSQKLFGNRQAMATKGALENQRAQFTSSHGKVATLGNSFAGINTLVEQIRRKKMRNNSILALVIAGCVCFTLWWVVLSKI
ncbi:hypothetical protein BBJ28_00015951 [Nothophytophthora sp. Chile5]|nr:hypothetical protein BBJ28_00015951 [Nothophytophthora sp. Chile5]